MALSHSFGRNSSFSNVTVVSLKAGGASDKSSSDDSILDFFENKYKPQGDVKMTFDPILQQAANSVVQDRNVADITVVHGFGSNK